MKIDKENMDVAIFAVNKFLFYNWNYGMVACDWEDVFGDKHHDYVPDFITGAAWTCNLPHMIHKWFSITDNHEPTAYIPKFYGELDKENRRALLEYVLATYNDEQKIQ